MTVQTLDIAGTKLNLERIRFDDIQVGDTVVHLVEDEMGRQKIWLGTVTTKTGQGEWYGAERHSSKRDPYLTDSEWSELKRAYRANDDILIVAAWHDSDSPEGTNADDNTHSIHRVI